MDRAWGLGALGMLIMAAAPLRAQTFDEDVAFLEKHTPVVVLKDAKTGARVAVSPALQGRVMTSSARGEKGPSFGWVNRELIASGKRDPHFNPYGGEDRFWLGPEGGQFALFFKKGDPFDLAHWYTPGRDRHRGLRGRRARRRTASCSARTWRCPTPRARASTCGSIERCGSSRSTRRGRTWACPRRPGVDVVAYESENRITNTGKLPWKKETGLVSVWILGMFRPTPATTVVVPFKPGAEAALGPVVNDAYFGKVPADRLVVARERAVLPRRRSSSEQDRHTACSRAARAGQLRRKRPGAHPRPVHAARRTPPTT